MKNLFLFFLTLSALSRSTLASAQVIVTAVGGGIVLGDGGPAINAELNAPYGIALDDSGNLYICDVQNARIRKVSPGYGGIISTIAGNGIEGYSGDGGLGIYAQIRSAIDVFVDRYGNVYIADEANNCIRKVTTSDTITTIAGTGTSGYNGDGIPATTAQLNGAGGVAVDSMGNIYIADDENHRIRMVDTAGIIHTIAGTGIPGFSPDGSLADTAKIEPYQIRLDNKGNIYYEDYARLRKIDTAGIITTIAGNGIYGYSGDSGLATAAEIGGGAIAIDAFGNLYIADESANRIREVSIEDGIINSVAGNGIYGFSGDGGPPLMAEFRLTGGVAVDDSGYIYISDVGNNRIRLVTKHPLSVGNVIQNKESISVYPNPCYDHYTIQINSVIDEQAQVSLTDIMGAEVGKFELITNQPFTFQVGLAPGVYIIDATVAAQQFYQKLIIL